MFRVTVLADDSGVWCGNALRFATYDEAREYASDLASRWLLVRAWRVEQYDDATDEWREVCRTSDIVSA